ncbi:MAG: Nif11-like leader peptide family natural product precursor [Planctomycetota bacterium]
MSQKVLVAFLRFAADHEELADRLQRPTTFEEFTAIAIERGYDLSDLTARSIKRTVDIDCGITNPQRIDGGVRDDEHPEVMWRFCEHWKC